MTSNKNEEPTETDEQFSERIRAETRKKLKELAKPVDHEAVMRSMAIEEPTHLGDLGRPRVSDT